MGNNAVTPFPSGAHAERQEGAPLPQIMQFRVNARPGWVPPQNAPLAGLDLRPDPGWRIQRLDPARATRTRSHSLVEIMGEEGPLMALLNNRTFDRPDYEGQPVSPGTMEVWEFVNTTEDAHPIHLHMVQFQVLDRQPVDTDGYLSAAGYDVTAQGWLVPNSGDYPPPSPVSYVVGTPQPPAVNELGWKDTVVAPPGTVTRIMVPFGSSGGDDKPIAAREVHVPGVGENDYVWHCHILEHEENDMMQHYKIG
jgi:FtsP/CotA-like multicopper oxidase with cupredoxin domain